MSYQYLHIPCMCLCFLVYNFIRVSHLSFAVFTNLHNSKPVNFMRVSHLNFVTFTNLYILIIFFF